MNKLALENLKEIKAEPACGKLKGPKKVATTCTHIVCTRKNEQRNRGDDAVNGASNEVAITGSGK